MLKHHLTIEVRYVETDPMGIAHHSSYWIWFEMARIKLLEAHGLHYRDFERRDEFLPMLEAEVEYLKPIRFGEYLRIETEAERKSLVMLHFHYRVYHCSPLKVFSEYLITRAHSRHAFINRAGSPIRFPKSLSALLPYQKAP